MAGRSEETAGENHPVPDGAVEPAHVQDLLAQLRALGARADLTAVREEIADVEALLRQAGAAGVIDSGVRRLDRRDAAEALVGSVVFATPLLVEGGVDDIAAHLLATRVGGLPVFLVANVAFAALMTYALVEWTGRDRTEQRRIHGILPTRVAMILAISFGTAAVLLTLWGRVGWADPGVALSRVIVLWTVGSLGAALGDSLSRDDPADLEPAATELTAGDRLPDSTVDPDPGAVVTRLDAEFDDVYDRLDDAGERETLRRIEAQATGAAVDDGFGDQIYKYTSRDVAEGFVGSVFFAIPLLVEDGVYDVADFLLSQTLAGVPVLFLFHAGFVLGTVSAILYWTGPQDVTVTRPIFGVVPRRLVGIAVVSFLTAAALMTMWGRLDGWQDPVVALGRISAVWAVAAFGAALGDILPGESSGEDINDQLADIGDRVAEEFD